MSGRKRAKRGIHQAAGFVLLVRQQGNHFFARRLIEQGQQPVAPFWSSFLDQVSGIVGREYAHPDVALFFGKAEQDNGLVMGTEVEEEIGLLAGMHFAKLFQPLGVREIRPAIPKLVDRRRVCGLGST